jgi:hypothetical protein
LASAAKGKIKKAAQAAAFEPISRFSAAKSTKRSANQPAGKEPNTAYPGLAVASWGKPEKQIRAA